MSPQKLLNLPHLKTVKLNIDRACNVNLHEGDYANIFGFHENITFTGWTFNEKNYKPVKKLYVVLDKHVFSVVPNLNRSDVAEKYEKIEILKCGFEVHLPRYLFFHGINTIHFLVLDDTRKQIAAQKTIKINLQERSEHIPESMKDTDDVKKKYELLLQERNILYNQLLYNYDYIHKLKNSISWKITEPFRIIADVFIHSQFIIKGSKEALRDNGIRGLIHFYKTLYKRRKNQIDDNQAALYNMFVMKNQPTRKELEKYRKNCLEFKLKPLISIVVPVYNVSERWLHKCVESVEQQIYENWELCLYDDCSTNKETVKYLKSISKKDKRIKVNFGKNNLHISLATNQAIKMATGEFIGLLDNDDELTPDALYEVVKIINNNPNIDFIYSDEDKLELDGSFSGPYFKPDYNLDLFLSNNYLCHFSVIRKTIGDKVGWFRKGYEGAQDYDLFLRVIEHANHIHHIPKVLYHWRKIPGSTAAQYSFKSYAIKSSINALTEYCQRNNIKATVENGYSPGFFRIKREILANDQVSIIIP
ncbi:MAG: glycosyltransferase, partial [Bacteroidales bacterium]